MNSDHASPGARWQCILAALAAFSTLLFVLTTAIWGRTLFATDEISAAPHSRVWDLRVRSSGDFVHASIDVVHRPHEALVGNPFNVGPSPIFVFGEVSVEHVSLSRMPQGLGSWVWWDHYIDQPAFGGAYEVWRVQFRPWVPIIPTMIVPLIWLRRSLARRRAWRAGRCTQCGYDLRATPGRCPECGAVPNAAAPAVTPP